MNIFVKSYRMGSEFFVPVMEGQFILDKSGFLLTDSVFHLC
jgi:hypothetical protein